MERLVGAPVETSHRTLDDDSVRQVRHEVERAVKDGIEFLQAARDTDPQRRFRDRLRSLVGDRP